MTGFGPVSWLLPLSSGVRESDFAHWTGSASYGGEPPHFVVGCFAR